jgi:hypothetical protein
MKVTVDGFITVEVSKDTPPISNRGKHPTMYVRDDEDLKVLCSSIIDGNLPSIFYEKISDFWHSRSVTTSSVHRTALASTAELELRERWEQTQVELVIKQLEELPRDMQIIEPSCGIGRWTTYLSAQFRSVVAFDIIPDFVSDVTALKLHNVEAVVGNVNDSASYTRHADVVFSAGTAPYMSTSDWRRLIRRLSSCKYFLLVESFSRELEGTLLLLDFYSQRLKCNYTAIYRPMSWWKRLFIDHGYSLAYSSCMDQSDANRSIRGVLLFRRCPTSVLEEN